MATSTHSVSGRSKYKAIVVSIGLGTGRISPREASRRVSATWTSEFEIVSSSVSSAIPPIRCVRATYAPAPSPENR